MKKKIYQVKPCFSGLVIPHNYVLFKRKFEKIPRIIFYGMYILFLLMQEGINKKEKKYCLKTISFLSPTNI